MSIINPLSKPKPITYPESDGKPIAENTLQFRWIVTLQGGIDAQYRNDPNVFVAGDLLWYPVEGEPTIRQAPDAMVVFGTPKGDRRSYRQWEEANIAPQVAFEVLSPGNRGGEMARKFKFYDRYGVDEYYIYDPDSEELWGWQRQGDSFTEIPQMNGWVSPRLGIRFDLSSGGLEVFGADGQRFVTIPELAELREKERQARALAENRAEKLAAQLRALGIEPQA
jgi:Uma2 family endonuclease